MCLRDHEHVILGGTMSDLLINVHQQVATLTLNKPQVHNAFDDVLIQSIIQSLNSINNDPDIRVVILKANGKHFSAGADLNWMKRMASLNESENKADAQSLSELMRTLNELTKPTIALVDGAAYGGAVGLISCCDMAIATQRSRFCLSEVKIGLSPAVISPYVVSAIGERTARRYFLTAEVFDADAAHSFGLIHSVVSDNQAQHEQVLTWVNSLLQNSPQALNKTKQLIRQVSRGEVNQDMRDETVSLIAGIRVSDEGQEGLTSFLEKRPANWCASLPLETLFPVDETSIPASNTAPSNERAS